MVGLADQSSIDAVSDRTSLPPEPSVELKLLLLICRKIPFYGLLYVIIILLTLSVQASAQSNYAVLINVSSKDTDLPRYNQFLEENLRSVLPDSVPIFVNIVHLGNISTENESAIQSELRDRLLAEIPDSATINFLYINTHANTVEEAPLVSSRLATSFAGIGTIFEDGWGSKFEQTLTGVRNKLAPTANVLLNCCSAFGGCKLSYQSRALTLMRFFGASQGRIFGATSKLMTPSIFAINSPWFEPALASAFAQTGYKQGLLNRAVIIDIENAAIKGVVNTEMTIDTVTKFISEMR